MKMIRKDQVLCFKGKKRMLFIGRVFRDGYGMLLYRGAKKPIVWKIETYKPRAQKEWRKWKY